MKDSSQLDNMNDLLRLIAPGTPFREGLENVLRAKTGALLVVGYSPEVMEVVDGGFSINCDFSPNYLYELAKMDGAIILSEDLKRILYANTQLIPDSRHQKQAFVTGQQSEWPNKPASWSCPSHSVEILLPCIRGHFDIHLRKSGLF